MVFGELQHEDSRNTVPRLQDALNFIHNILPDERHWIEINAIGQVLSPVRVEGQGNTLSSLVLYIAKQCEQDSWTAAHSAGPEDQTSLWIGWNR